jgi:preprotein translocase subunit SecD
MNTKEIKALITDWRVATLIILVVLSVIAINPHFDDQGNFTTNLQYGLDLQQGSWLQLEFQAEVVGFTTDLPVDEFITNLTKSLDAEVVQVDPNHLEIRKYYSQADLESNFIAAGGIITSYQQGVSKATAEDVKRILEN